MSDSFSEEEDEIIQISHEGEIVIATLLVQEVTMFVLAEVRNSLNEVVENKPPYLILDVSKTNYLDSSGIAVIFKLRHQILSYNGHFCISDLKGRLLTVLEKILKKDDIKCYDSLELALAAHKT